LIMDFIPELDGALGDKKIAKMLEQARHQIYDSIEDDAEPAPELSGRDVDILRRYASPSQGGSKTRAAAVAILGEHGPVTWEDAETWTQDEDDDVRDEAFFCIGSSQDALAQLCYQDKPRCVRIFVESAKRYSQLSVAARSLSMWTKESDVWADLFWEQLGLLLDRGDPQLSTNIICGVLEDFLVHGVVTVDDPRLQDWITGDSVERKMALLRVVRWFGMKEPWQRAITEQLADAPEEVVSTTAKRFLAGKGVPDIQDRGWVEKES
jgi:hypothetical protein